MSKIFILASQAAAWQYRQLVEREDGNSLVLNNSTGSSVSLTGLEIPGQGQGTERDLVNRGTSPVKLLANNAEALSVYRFSETATIEAGGSIRIFHNGANWEVSQTIAADSPNAVGMPSGALRDAVPTPFYVPSIPAAYQVLVAPAANTKALVYGTSAANPTAGAIGITPRIIYPGAIDRRVNALVSVAANSGNRPAIVVVVEAGETFGITPSAPGLSAWGVAAILPSTSGWKMPKLTTFIAGDNTLYQVPAGKIAHVFSLAGTNGPILGENRIQQYTNDSGGAVTVRWAYVPNGATTDLAVHALNGVGTSIANAGISQVSHMPSIMQAGDKIVVNTSANTAGQWAGMVIYETDA